MSDMDKYNNDSEISEENRSTEVSDADRGNASVKDTEHENRMTDMRRSATSAIDRRVSPAR